MLHTLLAGHGQELRVVAQRSRRLRVRHRGHVLQRSGNSCPSSWVESLLNPQT
jgi:hypothetical protein